ncbi:DNA-processing protein DprA [Pseudomonas sp. lyk4-TYG-107]|uniref:DNA-processing protein DprA n=1 Tax=Pseudomonas sp. lyk4-TYG-107 TaxID=3040317 RepID=UPI0025534417|nr:DNA-processing protein DprA [Pseudomonas sp. lyk4-TYG-107]
MTEISVVTKRLLTLGMLKGVGPSALKKVAGIIDFEVLPIEQLATHLPALSKALQAQDAWDKATEEAQVQIEQALSHGARIISPLDKGYPPLLAKTKDDPFVIFVKGELSATPIKSVAIIGTREPTMHGIVITQRMTEYFVSEGWSIVSGLALGCDAVAHQAALDAGGHTVAVLAHGLQTIAPSKHRKLADDILHSGGALISEFRFGQGALPQQFVKRDRTQAGMSQGVVMIQSDLKGGSLHASRAALDYERWLAVPSPTQLDRKNLEPKIQANLMLAEGLVSEKLNLLRCTSKALDGLLVLQSRDDYPLMTERKNRCEPESGQQSESLL